MPAQRHVYTSESVTEGHPDKIADQIRSEEHTSELQSRSDLVCRLLLEKKKKNSHSRLCQRNYRDSQLTAPRPALALAQGTAPQTSSQHLTPRPRYALHLDQSSNYGVTRSR